MDLVTVVVVTSSCCQREQNSTPLLEKEAGGAEGPTQIYPRSRNFRRRYDRPRTDGRGQVICPPKRPVPIWFGPMKAAARWGELRVDCSSIRATGKRKV
jgi:hypothetical protein